MGCHFLLWQPTPVFLPGNSHGRKSLVGYSPWGCKELDMTAATNTFLQGIFLTQGSNPGLLPYRQILYHLSPREAQSVLAAQSCPILCNPMDCSAPPPTLPGSSAHGLLQARILEGVAILFSRVSSRPRSPALQADSLPSEPPSNIRI